VQCRRRVDHGLTEKPPGFAELPEASSASLFTNTPSASLLLKASGARRVWANADSHQQSKPCHWLQLAMALTSWPSVYYCKHTPRVQLSMTDTSFFTVITGSREPIYRQVIAQVRRCVASGQIRAGDELPSVRDLAQALAVNPMTISKAYGLLESEGLLERRRGLGMVVAAQHERARPVAERVELLRPILEQAAREARELRVASTPALALFKTLLNDS
jgi:GntR family transcriptional regulator